MKCPILIRCAGIFALTVLNTQSAYSVEIVSYVFNDYIRSNGIGSIDLFSAKNPHRTVTGEVLESFRQSNYGELVFAVDVNEASSGSEFSDSQGVALKSVVLTVFFGEQVYQFSEFRTPTKSLLAENNNTDRSEYYTLIGTSGSNRISPNSGSEINNTSIDETLYIKVDTDLTTATGARLDVTLLTTNVALGDPEAFYDFSNGYEEVALLTYEDVVYLEQLAPGRDLAPLVISEAPSYNWVFYPSSQTYYVVSYEDLYPVKGDYDFNDLVVAYQVGLGLNQSGDVSIIRGNGYLLARGAAYDHDWHLHITLPTWASGSAVNALYAVGSYTPIQSYPRSSIVQGNVDLNLVEHVADVFADGESTYVNTYDYQTLVQGPKFDFQVDLITPVAVSEVSAAPFDPYIYVHDTNYEVHLVDRQPILNYSNNTLEGLVSFRDDAGFPFAMVIPDNWQPPLAGVDMGLAYPTFLDFVKSSGIQNSQWYAQPVGSRIKNMTPDDWKW